MRRSTIAEPRRHPLRARLEGWAAEYAGGRYEHVGWPGKSSLATAMKYHGPAPSGLAEVVQIDTPGDEVEGYVRELERARDGFRPGRVLRCEYWMADAPEEGKLQALRNMGLPMSRQGYYGYLKQARFYVAGRLGLPVSDEIDAE